MKQIKIYPIIAIPVIISVIVLTIWALCFPISDYCAEKKIWELYGRIQYTCIWHRKLSCKKGYTFAPVVIEVVYKSDSDFLYRYKYPICSFIDDRPEHVSIYTDIIRPEGCWHSYEELYEQLKYPPVTRKD